MMLFKSAQWRWNSTALVTSLCVAAGALSGQARAACLDSKTPHQAPPAKLSGMNLVPAVYYQGDATAGRLVRVSEPEFPSAPGPASIVGLWQYQLTGGTADWGTLSLHDDGTEITFSVGVDPEDGDVCQGVWKQIGPRTYTVNHIAMGWEAPGADPTKGAQFVRVHLHYLITLDPSGDKLTGTYTSDIYFESESNPFNEDPSTNPAIGHSSGIFTATRVKPDPGP